MDYNTLMNFFGKKYRKFFWITLAILFILSLNFFRTETKSFFYEISYPVQKNFWEAGVRAFSYFSSLGQSYFLKEENRILESRILDLLEENMRLKEFVGENQALRQALNLGLEKDFNLKLAELTGKASQGDSIFINKGSSSGLSEGMPLLSVEGILAGVITEVYNDFSRASLITNEDVSFNARVEGKEDIQGLVKGKGGMEMVFDLIPRTSDLKEGDMVLSTGLEGIFPPGIMVGQVKEIEADDAAPFKRAVLEPYFDLESLEWLFIITGTK